MAITLKTVKQLDALTTVPTNVDVIVNDANGVTKRAQLSNVLSLDNIPSAALERLVKVANQAARFALTTAEVQLGDSVLQLDTEIMYVVVDTTKLDSEDGYQEYKAGTAAKAYSDESGNNIKSNYASSMEISNGNLVLKNKNGTALSTQALPSTVGTFYGVETTASGNTNAKTATVSNNDFVLANGITVVIKFVNTNTYEATANNPITLNVNNTGAKSIIVKSNTLPIGINSMIFGKADYYNTYVYDGTYWVWQACSYKGTEKNNIFTGTMSAWEQLSNAQQDEYDIINITDDEGTYDTLQTFVGTRQEWAELTATEKARYVFVEFIDDGGYGNSYDIPYNSTTVGNELDSIQAKIEDSGDAYDTTKAYKVGDRIIYNNTLYKCKTACSAGSWAANENCFEVDTLTNTVTELNSALKKQLLDDNYVYLNETIPYNSSFTAPADGLYFFNLTGNAGTGSATLYNNPERTQALITTTASFSSDNIPLKKGKTIYTRNNSSTSYICLGYIPY